MLRLFICPALGAALVAPCFSDVGAQPATLSPFVTLIPSGSAQPMAGLAFTLGGGPLALRAGAHMSTQQRPASATSTSATTRPWAADADALAYLQGLTYGEGITFTPYVFVGLSAAAIDTGSVRIGQRGWSYGSGLRLPLGSAFGVFGEWRWRMSQFVLPNAQDAPSPKSEARFGLSFRIGGGNMTDEIPVIQAGEDGLVWEGASSPDAARSRVLSTAEEFVGTRYRRGGVSPSSGFDAAGFVRFVFARFGVILPRTSREQARVGERVRPDWQVVQPGDLVMFRDDDGITHVAIYAGRSRIVHASETGGGVVYDDLTTDRGRWFLERLVAARRVTPDLRGLLLDLAREVTGEDADGSDRPDRAPRASSRRRR